MGKTMATHANSGIAAQGPIKAKAEIGSWKDCDDFLEGAVEKTVASNVVIRHNWRDDTFCVVLYDTPVVRYWKDKKTFSVSNGGFNTPTTAARVSQFTPDGYHFWHSNKQLTTYIDGKPTHVEGVKLPIKRK